MPHCIPNTTILTVVMRINQEHTPKSLCCGGIKGVANYLEEYKLKRAIITAARNLSAVMSKPIFCPSYPWQGLMPNLNHLNSFQNMLLFSFLSPKLEGVHITLPKPTG